MKDPVTAPTGITSDRESLEGWLARGRATCPITGGPVRLQDLVPNHAMRRKIQNWCVTGRRAIATAAAIYEGLFCKIGRHKFFIFVTIKPQKW
jgi:hypothetical protein